MCKEGCTQTHGATEQRQKPKCSIEGWIFPLLHNPNSRHHKFLQAEIIKSNLSLNLQYYAEARNEFEGPSPRHSASKQHSSFRGNVAAMASRWKLCNRFDRPKI